MAFGLFCIFVIGLQEAELTVHMCALIDGHLSGSASNADGSV